MASKIKDRIIGTAWELFREKGFGETTINDIIKAAEISKGTFYYYFRSKDDMLDTLSVVLDNEYVKLEQNEDKEMSVFDRLIYINKEVHTFINDHIDHRLIAYLYSAQIIKDDPSSLLDRNRYYFRYLEKLMDEGKKNGELTDELSIPDLIKFYGLAERALVTDWCMNNGNYHLGEYSEKIFPLMIQGIRK
ncbi:MAG: TetR/AcrR family transcriptional regulator [Mogibacterium sp.]|nr:TetR/AcrR family transcriptional regulator [Mogibacterium sp.]